jgi:hypothetical protein
VGEIQDLDHLHPGRRQRAARLVPESTPPHPPASPPA